MIAVVVVTAFFGLIWLYVREFPVLSNTLYIRLLLLMAVVLGLSLSATTLWVFRNRFRPWARHIPELLSISTVYLLFMPLVMSLLNRAGGSVSHEPFEFIAESPYLAAQYGILKGEKIQPTGYRLRVVKNERIYTFRYKNQAYFPLTKPGETVLLPLHTGLLGFPVVQLQ